VIGRSDPTTGQAIAAFVILRSGFEASEALGEGLRVHVADTIGPIAKPKSILFTEELRPDSPLVGSIKQLKSGGAGGTTPTQAPAATQAPTQAPATATPRPTATASPSPTR